MAAMKRDAMASAGIHPVRRMTIAATMTAADPIRSPITSRYAPRTLMLVRCARLSNHIEMALATRPTTATTSMSPPATSTSPGFTSRPMPSTATQVARAIRITALISAPNTSAR